MVVVIAIVVFESRSWYSGGFDDGRGRGHGHSRGHGCGHSCGRDVRLNEEKATS